MTATASRSKKPNSKPLVTESRFFSQEFNTAIIDGPLRIYFSGRQEARALRLYFEIQEKLHDVDQKLSQFPQESPHFYLMLYPTKQSYINVFNWEDRFVFDRLGEHMILGVDCSDDEDESSEFVPKVFSALEYAFNESGEWPKES